MKQFVRNFKRQKVAGTLNLIGLGIGIAVALIIGLWTINELSFDNFHERGDRMYRVTQSFVMNENEITAATSFKPLGELAINQISGIEAMCRVVKKTDGVIIDNELHLGMTNLVCDSNFFTFFTFPLKDGDPAYVLSNSDKVVISESAARRLFPDVDPIGRRLFFHTQDFTVSGVMFDMPSNSHIQADIVFPLFADYKESQWDSSFSYDTYFILNENAVIPTIEEQLLEIGKFGVPSFLREGKIGIELQHLRDIHFGKGDAEFDSAIKGNKKELYTLLVIALVILVVSSVNFSNLFVSITFVRAKGIGIKKAHGAEKCRLVKDFYLETLMYVLLALAGALLICLVLLPVFNAHMGTETRIDLRDPLLYLFMVAIIIVTCLMAGTIPALKLTTIGITDTLSGRFKREQLTLLRKLLVVFQFTASICLLVIVLFINKQIRFIQAYDLGFDNENIVYVWGWGDFGSDYKSLKNEMMDNPYIVDVAMKQYDLPLWSGNGIGVRNRETGQSVLMDLSEISANYFDFFGVEFVAGENPFRDDRPFVRECVINERAAEVLGLTDPIDKTIQFVSVGGKLAEEEGQPYIVKGVIRDAYFKSLHHAPEPQVFLPLSREQSNPIFFKITGNPIMAINAIEKEWKEKAQNDSFEYYFLDETYQQQYERERSIRRILNIALIVTIAISISGLFSITFHESQRRMKELAIRKVNGATTEGLIHLLNKDLIRLYAIAFPLASVIAVLFLKNWLKNFIVKVPMEPGLFVLAGVLTLAAGLITVSGQTWKAASTNPADLLKTE